VPLHPFAPLCTPLHPFAPLCTPLHLQMIVPIEKCCDALRCSGPHARYTDWFRKCLP
jgi:hypothetical protein